MIRFLLLLTLVFMSGSAQAADLDYKDFAHIPIQHEGRVKPLDTFSRLYLKAFSGRENLSDQDHLDWMAEAMFDPAVAIRKPVFRIFRPELLNIPERKGRLYSYIELVAALQSVSPSLEALRKTDPANWNEDQMELAQLQDYSILYTQILRSFSLLLPQTITPPDILLKEWKLQRDDLTLQDIRKYRERLETRVKKIVRAKGTDPAGYTEDEKQIALFAFEMQTLLSAGENNVLLRIIPTTWNDENREWLSPWAVTQEGKGSPRTAELMELWKQAAQAYADEDSALWSKSIADLRAKSEDYADPLTLSVEIQYNAYHPLQTAMAFYLLSFLLFAIWTMNRRGILHKAAFVLLSAGWLFNLFAILGRIVILQRPPVGTLYESILFVSLICVAACAFLEARRKDGNGLMIGSLCGGLLLFLAEGFAEDDSLKMLVAVLNTNFWLGTHVLCITIGYGLCLITAGYAHLYLWKASRGSPQAEELVSPVRTMALLALLFTAVGTILGGVWADQSWGRFWGWDPKENGALLIVLWLVWILHGQISGHLKRTEYMICTALLAMVVVLAWFGVNLLNVGLHSYGFITGVTGGLAAFCLTETALIGLLWHRIYRMKQASS